MPPPNAVLTASYPLPAGSDGYRSVHPVTQSYKELYPVLASHERLAADRDYATTLQMRQTAAALCEHHLPCSFSSPDVWACPVHGHMTIVDGTLPIRRSMRRHRPPPVERLYELTTGPDHLLPRDHMGISQVPDSPFYHELDPNAFNADIVGRLQLGSVASAADVDNNNESAAIATQP